MSYDSHVNLHSRKRKHDNEEVSAGKKFCANKQTYKAANKTVPIQNAKQECSGRTDNQQLKHYSANDRLKKLRANLEANTLNRTDKSASRGHFSKNILSKTLSNSSSETARSKCDIAEPTTSSKYKFNSSVDDCAMEWCSLGDEEVLFEVQETRKITSRQGINPQMTIQASTSNNVTNSFDEKILNETYIVVDTNIFLSYLHIIKNILNIQFNGPIIYVPWMVIEELDYMKENKSDSRLKDAAKTAIKYINKQLHVQNRKFKGQQVKDAIEQFSSKNPDDGILHCCLQMMKSHNQLILLTNDVNLQNKALIHGITTYNHKEVLQVLDMHKSSYQDNNLIKSKYKEIRLIKTQMDILFNLIISTELNKHYGKALSGMHITASPWSLIECLNLFQRFWKPVFSCNLQKQFQHTVNNFKTLLQDHQDTSDCSINEVNDLVAISFSTCVYLQNGFPEYMDKIKKCISEVQSIADGLT